jgi:hypothetical protein
MKTNETCSTCQYYPSQEQFGRYEQHQATMANKPARWCQNKNSPLNGIEITENMAACMGCLYHTEREGKSSTESKVIRKFFEDAKRYGFFQDIDTEIKEAEAEIKTLSKLEQFIESMQQKLNKSKQQRNERKGKNYTI